MSKTWAQKARKVSQELALLLQEWCPYPDYGLTYALEKAVALLRQAADQWEKEHPKAECPRCKGSGEFNGWMVKKTVPVQCGRCQGSGEVYEG